MLEVADVLRPYGQDYLQAYGSAVPRRHRRVIEALVACRTAELGGHLYECDRCGWRRYAYHSCRNRHCPKCHGGETQSWIDERRKELLPVPHFHLVFTLPEELRRIVRTHQHLLYPVLMKTAAASVQKLARDPRYVGARIGAMAVLHTWARTLEYHPHVHCLIPAGGTDDEGNWIPARHKNFLVPVRALSRLFRGMFMQEAKRLLPQQNWSKSVWTKDWVVFVKPTVQQPERVLEYLGRYVHRVALANSRIVAITDEGVTFRYCRVGETQQRTMTLPPREFIRRFLQHVLPNGFHKVRYYGLWAPANRRQLQQVRSRLLAGQTTATEAAAEEHHDSPDHSLPEPLRCPSCHQGYLQCVAWLRPEARAPPAAVHCAGAQVPKQ